MIAKCKTAGLLVFTSLLTGCASMRYSNFVGQDSTSGFGTWPNSTGAMSETDYAIPVYRGWPEREYAVIGSIRLESPSQEWDGGDISAAARLGKNRGADALVIRYGSEYGVAKVAGAKADAAILSSGYTSALAVRWLTPQEIEDQENFLAKLRTQYGVIRPDLTINRTLAELAVAHLVRSGRSVRSSSFPEEFSAILDGATAKSPDSLEGNWIFKATISTGSALSTGEDEEHIGIASASQEAENLVIVSREGTIEFNLSGLLVRQRLSGQIGLGRYSGKCEGAATPDKISISFQSANADGITRGNIVLQRLIKTPTPNENTTNTPAGKRA